MSRPSLLVSDHDDRLAAAVAGGLARQGYQVTRSADVLAPAARTAFDAVLVDPPPGRIADLCAGLRRFGDPAIIVMTAAAEPTARVGALRAGADDVLGKPFHFTELLARLDAVLRRRVRPDRQLVVGDLRVDLAARCATVHGQPVQLSLKEFELLAVLAANPGTPVDRQRLGALVWHRDQLGRSRTIDVHIATLRAKVRTVVSVQSVRGVGYRLLSTLDC